MNNNIFNGQQQNGFYPYPYQAGMATSLRQEVPTYMMSQPMAPAFIKGRPVSSLEEARVAQIDLDGSIFIFPDLGNKKIYSKRINADGTATLQTYTLDTTPIASNAEEKGSDYATKDEVSELKAILTDIVAQLRGSTDSVKPTINF